MTLKFVTVLRNSTVVISAPKDLGCARIKGVCHHAQLGD